MNCFKVSTAREGGGGGGGGGECAKRTFKKLSLIEIVPLFAMQKQ